jgi:hypothetical protein
MVCTGDIVSSSKLRRSSIFQSAGKVQVFRLTEEESKAEPLKNIEKQSFIRRKEQ